MSVVVYDCLPQTFAEQVASVLERKRPLFALDPDGNVLLEGELDLLRVLGLEPRPTPWAPPVRLRPSALAATKGMGSTL